MAIATVTNKGEITIPQEIREYLKLSDGSKINFVIDRDGQVKIIPLNVPVESLSGMLHRPGMEKATMEEMEAAIREGAVELDLTQTFSFATSPGMMKNSGNKLLN